MEKNDRDTSGAIVWLAGVTVILMIAGAIELISHFI